MHAISKLLLLPLLLLIVMQEATAQVVPHKIRIGGYVGGTFDPSSLTDPGGRLDNTSADSFSGGLEVDMEYTDVFSVGSGFAIKNYA